VTLFRGESVAILGKSGSGKSTLLNLISGIDRTDGGAIRVNGRELTALDERQRTHFRRRHPVSGRGRVGHDRRDGSRAGRWRTGLAAAQFKFSHRFSDQLEE